MRKIFVLTVFAVFAFASTGITAMMDMGAAPAASEQTECGQESAESDCGMGSGTMGEPGDGAMAPQSMRGYGSGYGMGGMMSGYGAMQGYGMGYGMMGPGAMQGYGMGGMMGGYGGDCGMTGGMMGNYGHGAMHGYGLGYGMGGKYPANEEELRFLTETRELRREIHIKKFDYKEAMRNPESSRKKVGKLAGELWELKQKLYNKRSADQ